MIMGHYSASCQEITMEQTLTYINEKLEGKATVEIERGAIIYKSFKDGEAFREDKVSIKDINAEGIHYDTTEKAVIISCKKGKEQCVDRRLYVTKKRKFYSRLNIIVEQENSSGNAMAKAFKHASMLVLDSKYKSSEPFE